jgi:hypothetical protein
MALLLGVFWFHLGAMCALWSQCSRQEKRGALALQIFLLLGYVILRTTIHASDR